jgi:3-carboxy-cis,cis-muconate cycloisomerase
MTCAYGGHASPVYSRINSFNRLSRESDIVGYPVLPLVRQLVEATPPEMAKYIHFGATTQDIMDDASMLQIHSGLEIVEKELNELIEVTSRLATKHRDT